MRKLSGLMIVCIPLYAWGSESFPVNLSLHETPKYAMNTSDYESLALPPPPLLPKPIAYLLEGVAGCVGGFVGGFTGWSMAAPRWALGEDEGAGMIGASLGLILGMSGGVTLTAKWIEDEGSFWKSFLGTAVGLAGTVGVISIIDDMEPSPLIGAIGGVSISLPIVGGVWGYHLGGPSYHIY